MSESEVKTAGQGDVVRVAKEIDGTNLYRVQDGEQSAASIPVGHVFTVLETGRFGALVLAAMKIANPEDSEVEIMMRFIQFGLATDADPFEVYYAVGLDVSGEREIMWLPSSKFELVTP